jgi:acetylornithine deacetylase/succinyl-diaminopimelate desuccinylase-like protein
VDVISICRDLLRIDTSNPGSTEERAAAYVVDRLEAAGIGTVVIEPAPGRCSVFSRHQGSDRSQPGLLVHGHLDVVPAPTTGWRHGPFGGVEADGCLWGRGAVDMKNTIAIMLATQLSFAENRERPRRDVTFAYLADEEAGGILGAQWAVEKRPDLFAGVTEALGELGGFRVTLPNGRRIYPLQCAEKGMLWIRISAAGCGGHSALSDAPNPLVRLARVTNRVASLRTADPPPQAFVQLVEQLSQLLEKPDSAQAPEDLLQGLGSFGSMSLKASRTTFVPTMNSSGMAVNVIPERAEVFVDCRFVPGGRDAALAAVRSVLDDDMACDVVNSSPGVEAPVEGELAAAAQSAVEQHDPGAVVVPWALPAGTDAQRFVSLGIAGYGFTPLVLPAGIDHAALFHAVNERVPLSALVRGYGIFRTLVTAY